MAKAMLSGSRGAKNQMNYETVQYEVSDHTATVTLYRPDRFNAITSQLEIDLLNAMQKADLDDDVRVIILTGAGRGFCAGADLELLQTVMEIDWATADKASLRKKIMADRDFENTRPDFNKTWSYFPAIRKPIIGAINGAAVGLGFVLQLYCDIRIASDEAKFGTAFSQRGLIAEHGSSWLLPRLIGVSNAFDLLYSSRIIKADEALRMGLVSRVVPHDALMSTVREYAAHLAANVSPLSLRVIKKQVYNALISDLGEAIESANDEMLISFASKDFAEGVAHFIEKRAPKFTGT
jgi:enoyl-CoA hydratase/carnithine racemase